MRWIFAERSKSNEGRTVAEIDTAIEAWWQVFTAKVADIDAQITGKMKWDLPTWIIEHLSTIDEALMWEFGPAVKGPGHRLVISPESRKDLRPLANSLVAAAPKLPGWEFYPYRLAEKDHIAETIAGRTGGSIEGIEVVVEREDCNLIGLRFQSPKFSGPEDAEAGNIAFVLAETLLGEEVLDHWIGTIEVERKKKGFLSIGKSKGKAIPLSDLNAAVTSTIGDIRNSLPKEAHFQWWDSTEWSILKLQPEENDDYVGRADLMIHTTLNPDLVGASFRPGFCSARYSRNKETFCYLKIDGAEGLDGSVYADRNDIQDALNDLLVKSKAGCCIGGGTGLRYAYIDLALLEFTKTSRAVCDLLRKGKVPQRSWLLFMDGDYCDEWLGVYNDTPPPPADEVED
ncbi:hypothetical protein BH11PLA2_BH11PLA2_49660 [soil metagenome]